MNLLRKPMNPTRTAEQLLALRYDASLTIPQRWELIAEIDAAIDRLLLCQHVPLPTGWATAIGTRIGELAEKRIVIWLTIQPQAEPILRAFSPWTQS